MKTLIETKDLILNCSEDPKPYARVIMPADCYLERLDKLDFPFKQKVPVDFVVCYKGNMYFVNFEEYVNDDNGFKFDGASIPKIFHSFIGHNGDPKFLLAAFFHDIFCNDKKLIGYDRKLSSIVFKEILLSCGVPKWKANIMYHLVDNYQKLKDWNEPK